MGVPGIGSRGRGRMAATGVRRAAVVAFATFLTVGLTPLTASAATNIYSGTGYDVSYPNCTDSVPYNPTFGIVGMTGGRPFSTNGCAATEWQTASKWSVGPSAYFNTGYAGAYAKSITGTCSGLSQTTAVNLGTFNGLKGHAISQAEEAWAIGCSEVDWAQSVLGGFTTSAPVMWWADIETGNSWSMNTSLNQFTIDGISYEMQHMTSVPGLGGIYSTVASWSKITGSASWTPTPPPSANWVAGVTNCTNASSPFDTSVPAWLVQTSQTGSVDVDTVC